MGEDGVLVVHYFKCSRKVQKDDHRWREAAHAVSSFSVTATETTKIVGIKKVVLVKMRRKFDEDSRFECFGGNGRRETGLLLLTSDRLSVAFFWRGITLASLRESTKQAVD